MSKKLDSAFESSISELIMTNQALDLEQKLKEFFGYNGFRNYQREIIEALLDKNDVMAILPTGAGKSICYQLPALVTSGTAIVISPLISLMQDQVVSLYKNGIPAAFINSSLHYRELQEVLNNLSSYKLIYVAPERFADPIFLEKLKETNISFFVIDEAHCISQWGHSFRVEYRKLSILKSHFPRCPIMALTATATPEVEKDIMAQLSITSNCKIFKGSFDRPNLTIRINQKTKSQTPLLTFLEKQKGKSGILYAATRKSVDSTYHDLQQAGWNVGRYHAGMGDQERSRSQNDFIYDKVSCMVATIAFGMGIHKPDIRFIVHLDMPKTIEQYYQEIGRAGRDGLPAECLMFYSPQDIVLYKSFLEDLEDKEQKRLMQQKTEKMYSLCNSVSCRRKGLLNYFGEKALSPTCVACDNCLDDVDTTDGTIIAQKILSCVFRLQQRFGVRYTMDVLRGAKTQIIQERSHNTLSTYGIMSDVSEQELRYYIDSLINMGYLEITEGDYPILKWTQNSRPIIDGKQQIQFRKKIFKEAKTKQPSAIEYNHDLYNQLHELRTESANNENIPPFVVFSDRTLQEMSAYFPRTKHELSKINGVGPIKWVKYGEKFLGKIAEFLASDQGIHLSTPSASITSKPAVIKKTSNPAEESAILFNKGYSIEQIAQLRGLVKGTIQAHLLKMLLEGFNINLLSLVSPDKQAAIREIILQIGSEKLTPIKEKLQEDVTYDEIRIMCAYHQMQA